MIERGEAIEAEREKPLRSLSSFAANSSVSSRRAHALRGRSVFNQEEALVPTGGNRANGETRSCARIARAGSHTLKVRVTREIAPTDVSHPLFPHFPPVQFIRGFEGLSWSKVVWSRLVLQVRVLLFFARSGGEDLREEFLFRFGRVFGAD